MTNLEEKISEFYSHFGIEKDKQEIFNNPKDGIIDPGAKTVESLCSKVVRNVDIFGDKNFTLGKISDMNRCAVLFDSYAEIPVFLQKMKEIIPETTGYISRFENGYRGIHLNFTVNGITTEVQLSTYKAWAVKQATEINYQKWRDFNQRSEAVGIIELAEKIDDFESSNFSMTESQKEQLQHMNSELTEKRDSYQRKLSEMKIDNNLCAQLYEDLHKDGDFHSIENDLETLLYYYNTQTPQQKREGENKIFNTEFKIKDDGLVDTEEVNRMAKQVFEISDKNQEDLINKIKLTKEAYLNLDKSKNLTNNPELLFVRQTAKAYDDLINEKLPPDVQQKYINKISYQKFSLVVESIKYNNSLDKSQQTSDPRKVLEQFTLHEMETSKNFEGSNYDVRGLVTKIRSAEQENVYTRKM